MSELGAPPGKRRVYSYTGSYGETVLYPSAMEVYENYPLSFDRSFLLTIPRLVDSRAKPTLEHLKSVGIEAEIFTGVDGLIAGLETKWTYERDHPGSNYHIGPKTVSMHIGHEMIWKVCQYLEGDSFLIMEDDVRFNADWKDHFDFAMPVIQDDWDLIYLGSCCAMDKPGRVQIKGHLHKIASAFCTHAYCVRKKALPTLFENCQKIYAGIDLSMAEHAIPKLNTYAFLPRLAYQHETDIAP